MMFYMTLILSSMISISANSWLSMWIGLEINLLSIIPLMNSSKNMMSSESSIKYFITQVFASSMLMFAIIYMYNQSYNFINLNSFIYMSALLTKMGAAPFHFWFPEVIEGLNWLNSMILLTWQKIAPMIMLTYNLNINFLTIIIILCMLISGIMGINQISLRKIMAYSSINHMGWMISTFFFIETMWIYYFMIYTIITINLSFMFMKFNIFYLNQLYSILKENIFIKLFFILNFMNLGGLPPFLGFLPKWITVQTLIINKFYILSFFMMILTLLTLYFYMRITFSTILLSSNEIFFTKSPTFNLFSLILFNFISLSSLILCTMIFNLT
uniref:NADH-ubiquinone oxidoreductase chain 2 n=1 Tax=Hydrochus carinatus TaxID=395081 RepID=A0A343A3U9_9COLE|nr:NADH dehydrogenase subunit 2 [Hydrochus carinatus]AOY39227.1 NADH dehydrogenase subunit 2 [Hydrochus carinatus]